MRIAALDYWFAGLPVPSHRPEDFPDRAVPEDGARLADFIHSGCSTATPPGAPATS